MNQLDVLLESLTARYAADLGLSEQLIDRMVKEIASCANAGYNTRHELITLVKSAMVSA